MRILLPTPCRPSSARTVTNTSPFYEVGPCDGLQNRGGPGAGRREGRFVSGCSPGLPVVKATSSLRTEVECPRSSPTPRS